MQGYYAYESVNYPLRYIHHGDYRLYLSGVNDIQDDVYKGDVSWRLVNSEYPVRTQSVPSPYPVRRIDKASPTRLWISRFVC